MEAFSPAGDEREAERDVYGVGKEGERLRQDMGVGATLLHVSGQRGVGANVVADVRDVARQILADDAAGGEVMAGGRGAVDERVGGEGLPGAGGADLVVAQAVVSDKRNRAGCGVGMAANDVEVGGKRCWASRCPSSDARTMLGIQVPKQ